MTVVGVAKETGVWAVVPLKSLRGAKKRLADLLDEEQREAFVTAMARDVLAALVASSGIDGIVVVSDAAAVTEVALEYGARVLPEGEQPGLSGAIACAARLLVADRVDRMMVVHGDIPLAIPADFELLLENTGPAPSVTIVPCRNEDGSNVMICTPPDAIPFLYGPASCSAHQRAARDAGIEARIERLPRLALDIDTPEDLAFLLERHAEGEANPATARFLSGLDLSTRFG
ncbi:MAG: 2-phospho-L-lactate guanylyltransferase [Proteobacteria bacterium]|nr:2-phospho-L-lactate guanylyltransferase [Pseudomonadota bacterium]